MLSLCLSHSSNGQTATFRKKLKIASENGDRGYDSGRILFVCLKKFTGEMI